MRVLLRTLLASLPLSALAATLLCGCTSTTVKRPPKDVYEGTGPRKAVANLFMRSSFDEDPSLYVGRFVPPGVANHDLDENAAAQTLCSEFIAFKSVRAGGSFSEMFNASTGFRASLGIAGIGSAGGGSGASTSVRVEYDVTGKMQGYIKDVRAFTKCCADTPDQCAGVYIGEFIRGTGKVFQFAGNESDFKAGGTYKTVTAGVEFKDGFAWQRATKFNDVYFAFKTTRAMLPGATSLAPKGSGCAWADNPPKRWDGKYFVGVSNPTPFEGDARTKAMVHARRQVVAYLGEAISSVIGSEVSGIEGFMKDSDVVQAVSKGIASRVKSEKWCPAQKLKGPTGYKYVVKVLAFFPEAELAAAAAEAAAKAAETLEGNGKVDAEQAKKIRDAGRRVKK